MPALALGIGATPHFSDGLALDRALPVPSYMIAGTALPKGIYLGAVAALDGASPADGFAGAARAEAAMHADAPGASQIPLLEHALAAAPASPRTWLLLAQAQLQTDRAKAATALSQALILAPYDYWVAAGRTRYAALLWSDLDADARSRALGQVRLLWEEPQFHAQLLQLLTLPKVPKLVDRAFAGRRDERVELYRWASATRRRAPPQYREPAR
ncbi:MAG: hypothetical protein WDN08_06185 [Rhizomicrobium sp.]